MLKDGHGRQVDYLRVSVTDRCDLRCFYCLPKGFKGFCGHEERLSPEEIGRLVAAFAELGVSRVRLTGGEPLVRTDIVEVCEAVASISGIEDLSLSTNGVRLGKLAGALKTAGVDRLNVSLDSLRAERFAEITGGGDLQSVLDGVSAAIEAGLVPMKINAVVMKGINDDEVEAMVSYCDAHGITLRFIETMPMGQTGRDAADRFIDLREVRDRLEATYDLIPDVFPGGGPARYVRIAGTDTRIGFITPLSQHFCDTCNRVRVGSDGVLYTCLGSEHAVALRPWLQEGERDGLIETIQGALARKPARHDFGGDTRVVRYMAQTGG
ncbi:GTP 3',8-cyclase MoaA [Thiohalomonas denitrificans]|uniref:GTP 3',8-cyclase MoaA n=1 Tax=Thiohalomonas denitrificans TaxID=415747 RepID=UPI0026EA3FCD|nr:GTP 3',8-cyclase MoaA [Thiohalomonas denitrificans]